MGVIDTFKAVFGGADSEDKYVYHCNDCNSKFVSTVKDINDATCTDCGTSDIRK